MRLHRLEVTAFGPFAETASVDFDALSDAGLFLLTGATGAGKTSVLDAVCFALYGEVPGDRQAARRLRCDQAEDGVRPRVTLELSLAGRRFRVVRSPSWERPKKRGAGMTTEQASVTFSERVDGEWSHLSSRLDETGHLVTSLVGMNLTQFCQVGMLPQGRFQAFLRARSDERHRLLQQLFRTGRFEEVERWLRDRRSALRRISRDHHERVADLVSRLSEAAATTPPDAWDLHDLADPAGQGALGRWSGRLRRQAEVAAGGATTAATAAAAAEQHARGALEQGRSLAQAQAEHAAALAERERLEAAGGARRSQADRVAAARRAATVVPLHRLAEQQRRALAAAETSCAALTARLGPELGGVPDRDSLARGLRAAREAAAATRALLPRRTTLLRARAVAAEAGAEAEALQQRLESLDAQLAEVPARRSAATAALAESVAACDQHATAVAEVRSLRTRLEAARHATALVGDLEEARGLLSAAVDEVQLLKERWLQLQERRIHGMAAELAGALAVGADCPVCGSVDHPRPAPARAGAPDADSERAARRLVDDAEAARHAREGQVRDLATRLAVARERAGEGSPTPIEQELVDAEGRAAASAALAGEHLRRSAALTELEERAAYCAAERTTVLEALVLARSRSEAADAEARVADAELADALAGSGADDLDQLLARHEQSAQSCQEALDALVTLQHARSTAAAAQREATDAASAAGFPDPGSAVAAALTEEELAVLESAVRDHDAALARTEAALTHPELRAAAAAPAPDVPALAAAAEEAAGALARARGELSVASLRAQRLSRLHDELAGALEAWAPVRDELDLVTRVAALCDGTSPDNRLQMRLSGYVLAWRLTQVVAAANERLARMSGQRYSLEHTGRRGAGEQRGGLSLLVRDDWSGETRDPATLSGGETFVVSLALALGLADVIVHEVGGAELDSLFVDEGFGSLDADTLDDVMDTLDTLRDGGRVVGVVSHVAEMRDRIPTQLRVAKSRGGSTLSLAAADER